MYDGIMSDVPDVPIWETWESVFLKTTSLGNSIIKKTLQDNNKITRIAVVPRGGMYVVNILSRMLGLSGDQVLSIGISKYDVINPTEAEDFKSGQMPNRELVEGQTILLADEIADTGETMDKAVHLLKGLGAMAVMTAAIHHKPGPNTTGCKPDYSIEETNGWVHYPWETIDPMGAVYQQALTNGHR